MKPIRYLLLVLLLTSVVAGQTTKPRLTEQHLDMLFAQADEMVKAGRVDESETSLSSDFETGAGTA